MKGLGLYRLLSGILSIICFLLFPVFLLLLFAVFVDFSAALQLFIILSVLLYYWHSRKFFLQVYIQREPYTARSRDWLQVNGFVTLIATLFAVVNSALDLILPARKEATKATLKELVEVNPGTRQDYIDFAITASYCIAFFIFTVLVIHVTWTLLLVRKQMKLQKQEE
ncbi:hypothetical protein [Filimonas effusa]|uniref:Uncharacterized protein n=1 Tax=Filimonas effusa TaxID=2508721 RepID=A0A4V1M9V7_9BACT|nr:hypothetical protein [Filimonas effusa]RXK83014.1 hypothetical protein ESB13_12885 [Filimonas effusa]